MYKITAFARTTIVVSGLAFIGLTGCQQQPPETAKPTSTAQSLSAEDLSRRTTERRGVEAVLWGMPAVNFDRMYQAMVHDANGGEGSNKVVFWSRPLTWKNQTLTPNPDTIYLMPFFNTKEVGPVVLEIPPADTGSITGSVDDAWQTAIEDVGPAGVDKGKGGKYLILPPGYKDKVPAGYIPMPSETYESYALLRSNFQNATDAEIAKAVAYGKRIKVYPLSQASHPSDTQFIDAIDVLFDATIPYDMRFYESLNRIVQAEPWLTRDKAMIDPLKSIGIEKGKPFNPDAATQDTLKQAVLEAHAAFRPRFEQAFIPPFNEGKHWALPVSSEFVKGIETGYADPNSYPTDARGLTYSFGFFSAKHLGAGQYYLMTMKDNQGKLLDGAQTYRLNVPANAPVKLYWSAVAYYGDTHALIRNTQWSSRSSQTPGLQKNPDGSADIYFGPKAPSGKESNWIPTSANGKFEILFRFYGPEKALFDKTWVLPDLEKTN
ncbi:DUF1254 domain-containing protein [Terriglobus sp. RCC_193]|uniref:DUF1254 domain-containing protein n=1 Tax=Terriglobus sp. RCC_193 TaxID=3239218 RepID=UPI003525FA9C